MRLIVVFTRLYAYSCNREKCKDCEDEFKHIWGFSNVWEWDSKNISRERRLVVLRGNNFYRRRANLEKMCNKIRAINKKYTPCLILFHYDKDLAIALHKKCIDIIARRYTSSGSSWHLLKILGTKTKGGTPPDVTEWQIAFDKVWEAFTKERGEEHATSAAKLLCDIHALRSPILGLDMLGIIRQCNKIKLDLRNRGKAELEKHVDRFIRNVRRLVKSRMTDDNKNEIILKMSGYRTKLENSIQGALGGDNK